MDVLGYFTPATFIPGPDVYVATGGRFDAVTPTRILDARHATAMQYTGPKPVGGSIIEFAAMPTPLAPEFPVPAGMLHTSWLGAVVLNVTATESKGPGFVQVAPAVTLARRASSNLNLTTRNQTIANLVIVPMSSTGRVAIYTSGTTHLIADVLGYFTNDPAPNSFVALFVPLAPERVLDSRAASRVGGLHFDGSAGTSTPVRFEGLPTVVGAVVLNVTATETCGPGFVQAGVHLVAGAYSNLNVDSSNQTIPNLMIARTDHCSGPNFQRPLELFTSNTSHLVADIFGWFIGF